MFTSIKRLEQLLPRINIVATGATLLIAGAIGGWATIATSATDTSEVRMTDTSIQLLPNYLIGSYEVSGTDPDGKRYPRPEIVDISLAPSGALELDWNNGKRVGIGRVIGNILTIASSNHDGTIIMLMTINPDGSLNGQWSKRKDRGYRGTETWKKI